MRSTEPEGYCCSVAVQFAHAVMPMPEMQTRGIHFFSDRRKGRPHFEDALAFVSAGRAKPELITLEVKPFEQSHEVLREPSMKPILLRSTTLSTAFQPKAFAS